MRLATPTASCFVVTFDDGYELNIPPTVYRSAAGHARVPQDMRPMTMEHCKERSLDPVFDIGAHTPGHRIFLREPRGLQTLQLSTKSPGALVMDADYRGLAIVRSLGRKGIPVWVFTHGDQLLATRSRYTRRVLSWPGQDEQQKVNFLLDLADRENVRDWTLFPTGDESAALLARHHATLGECFKLTTPPWNVFKWGYDKRLTYQLADNVSVNHPRTAYPANREEILANQYTYTYPVILKPAYRSCLNRFTAAKAWRIENREQLLARYDEACTLVDPTILMVQELIPGGGESQFSYTALCQDGQPIASLTARRCRQIPMDFGRASTFVETVNEPGISQLATRFLQALHYTGVVEVEFKRDPRDRELKLLDVNCRVWGWHSLCGAAGVDYPYLLWLLTIGEPLPATKPTVGVRWVRMSTDAPMAMREVLRGRLSLREYFRSLRSPLAPAIYAADDRLPGVLEIPLLAYLLTKRVVSGGRIA
jgi:D-aspartate ligase